MIKYYVLENINIYDSYHTGWKYDIYNKDNYNMLIVNYLVPVSQWCESEKYVIETEQFVIEFEEEFEELLNTKTSVPDRIKTDKYSILLNYMGGYLDNINDNIIEIKKSILELYINHPYGNVNPMYDDELFTNELTSIITNLQILYLFMCDYNLLKLIINDTHSNIIVLTGMGHFKHFVDIFSVLEQEWH